MTDAKGAAPVRPVILFDGVCNLCNTTVQWVIKRDPDGQFRFGTLQSEAARELIADSVGPGGIDNLPDSIVLVDSAGIHTQSSAALRIARGLGFPHSVLGMFVIVPRPIRDAVYRLVARNRYGWFGRRDECMVPTPELATRFIKAEEAKT